MDREHHGARGCARGPRSAILRRMAQRNVELARSVLAGWERGDYELSGWADPQIEAVVVDGPTPGAWSGLTGMAAGWREFLGAWDDFRHEYGEECRELDE